MKHISGVSNEIEMAVALLKEEAEQIVYDFWIYFKSANQSIGEQIRVGLTDKKLGSVAPMIEEKKSGQRKKIYISWRVYGATALRKAAPHLSKRIVAKNNEYTITIFKKHCEPWELKRVLEAESELMRIREEIEVLHEALVAFGRRETRIKRLAARHKQHLNN